MRGKSGNNLEEVIPITMLYSNPMGGREVKGIKRKKVTTVYLEVS